MNKVLYQNLISIRAACTCIALSAILALYVAFKLSLKVEYGPANVEYAIWVVLPELKKVSAIIFYLAGLLILAVTFIQIVNINKGCPALKSKLLYIQLLVFGVSCLMACADRLVIVASFLVVSQYAYFWLSNYINPQQWICKLKKIALIFVLVNAVLVTFYSLVTPNEFFQYGSHTKHGELYLINDSFYKNEELNSEFAPAQMAVNGSSAMISSFAINSNSIDLHINGTNIKDRSKLSILNTIQFLESALFPKYIKTSDIVPEILKANAIEIFRASQFGWTYHHLIYSYGSMIKIASGIPLRSVVAIYGDLFSYLGGKVLSFFKGSELIAYVAYMTCLSFMFYIFYLFSFRSISKQTKISSVAVLTILLSQFIFTNELSALAPGLNTGRYIFFLINLHFLANYYKKETYLSLFLLLLSIVTGIIWSRDFGFFSGLSIIIALGYLWLRKNEYTLDLKFIVHLFGMIAFVGFFYIFPFSSKNPLNEYMLMGIATPNTSLPLVILALSAICLILFSFFLVMKRTPEFSVYYVYLVSYASLSIIYFLWYPSTHHIVPLLFPGSFILFLILKAFPEWSIKRLVSNIGRYYFILAIAGFGIYSFSADAKLINYYRTHKIFKWNIGYLNSYTTTDPQQVQSTVNFILENSRDEDLWMISYNDAFYSLAVMKNLGIPYVELSSSLVNDKVETDISQYIDKAKPNVIFVDNELINGWPYLIRTNGLINKYAHTGASSYIKYFGYDSLLRLYNKVSQCYEVSDTNGVISSMKRKINSPECQFD